MRISFQNPHLDAGGAGRPFLALALLMPFLLMTVEGVAKTLVVTPPKSIFVDKPEFGKDPFFPNSERRRKVEVVETNSVPLTFPEDLALNGLSGRLNHPLAIINGTTLAPGETGSVKVDGKKIKVHCLEIKPRSVRVRVNGRVRELFLRQNL